MGHFCDVLHVWLSDRDQVASALSNALTKWYTFTSTPITPPHPDADVNELLYFIAPKAGNWTVLIQAHAYRRGTPHLSDLAAVLSKKLSTCTLSLHVHDDDVLYYNLYSSGKELDGYNSNPQYFEQNRISEETIRSQRHNSVAFSPLLPHGIAYDQLQSILDKGWWAAYDARTLDQNGLAPHNAPNFSSEQERMIALGDYLHLHGAPTGYPYAAWYHSSKIDWGTLIALQGKPKAGATN